MIGNWVLVAAKSEAKIFEIKPNSRQWSVVTTIANAEGRLREGDLSTDRPGKTTKSRGPGPGYRSLNKGRSLKQQSDEMFAKKVGAIVDKAGAENSFSQLIVVADPGFMGPITKHLGKTMKSKICGVVNKNWVHLNVNQLQDRMKDIVFYSFPLS